MFSTTTKLKISKQQFTRRTVHKNADCWMGIVSDGKKQNNYIVVCVATDRFHVTGPNGSYQTDIWEQTCTCEGREQGFKCRHIRLAESLVSKGDI